MRSWKELGEEFRQLAPRMQGARLDFQWGAAGQYWRVCGGLWPEAQTRFDTLAHLAGEKLTQVSLPPEFAGIQNLPDSRIRWFEALKHLSGSFQFGVIATQRDDAGNFAGDILTGSIQNVLEAAANLCLRCELFESTALESGIPEILTNSGLEGAAIHWRNAVTYRSVSPANLPLAAKESVNALEGVARSVAGLQNATLADCIKQLRNQGRLSPGMAKSLEGLWAFASATPGIRHGATADLSLNAPEVDYLIQTCGSGIRLLLAANAT
jgi:hypothetical protein